jgi:hypothetical protein
VVELQDSVAVPEPVVLAGDIGEQVRPAGTVLVSVTVPVNPLTAVTVIVEAADWPTSTAAGEVAVMVKSVTVRLKVPLEPVWTESPL